MNPHATPNGRDGCTRPRVRHVGGRTCIYFAACDAWVTRGRDGVPELVYFCSEPSCLGRSERASEVPHPCCPEIGLLRVAVPSRERDGYVHEVGTVVRVVERIGSGFLVEAQIPDASLLGGLAFETIELEARELEPAARSSA